MLSKKHHRFKTRGLVATKNYAAIIDAYKKIVLNISLLWMISLLWARWMIHRGIMEAVLQFVEPKRRDNRGSLSLFFFKSRQRYFRPRIRLTRAHASGGACVLGAPNLTGVSF